MTDSSGFLASDRGWQAVLAGAVSVLVAGVVAVVARTGDPATADTYLAGVVEAAVVLPDGRSLPATDGMRVPPRAVVRTDAGGAATLSTAGRDVYLGEKSAAVVVDGVHQDLQSGQAMVDTRNGPHLVLGTTAGLVTVDDGALARVEEDNAFWQRVAVFDGTARFTPAGRQARTVVHALHQQKIPYGTVGQAVNPLHLVDDSWEHRLAPDLVTADLDLKALAEGLAGSEGQVVLESASVRLGSRVSAPTDELGEQALAVAVAEASSSHDPAATLQQVQGDRAAGGSWGVVAALVEAKVSAVSALLDQVLTPPDHGAARVDAGPGPDVSGLLLGQPNPPGTSPVPSPVSTPIPSGGPTRAPSPRRSPTPSPSPIASNLLSTVTGLLSPSPTPPIPDSTPSPTPILQLGPIRIG